MHDFNLFFKIRGQKINFLNFNTFFRYCYFPEFSCAIACELMAKLYLEIGYCCVGIY